MRPDTTGPLPGTTDVAIVGAGPTGLTLAAALAARGREFVLLDRQAAGAHESRAAVVHARTLEVLEELGVAAPMMAAGLPLTRFSMRDRTRLVGALEFGDLPTDYPVTLMLPQSDTERLLAERIDALGGVVHRCTAVTAVTQDGDGATVHTEAGDVRARYVVGADGMHSIVREAAGVAFAGASYQHSFVLADIRLDWSLPDDEVMMFFSPAGFFVVAPLPGGRYRVVAPTDHAPQHPDLADIQALFDARGPGGATVTELVGGSRFRVHHRLAERYRAGRLVLAGDAAHVHSPAGGQGMNTGIQDAAALATALTTALDGDDAALDRYEGLRRPIAEQVVALTDRMTRVATLRGTAARGARNVAMAAVLRSGWLRHRLAMNISELVYR
ncbi:MAG: FAD-dependent oxidoreductase [Actinocatenispora sp.]